MQLLVPGTWPFCLLFSAMAYVRLLINIHVQGTLLTVATKDNVFPWPVSL